MNRSKRNKPKDLTFVMTRKNPPLSWMVNSRNTTANPLHYYDEENNENRVLRYASNQKSCFEDEKDGTAIIEPIIFNDGMLVVPKTNPALQQFLQLHPKFGKDFVIQDKEKDAQTEYEQLEKSSTATEMARKLDIDQKLMIARVLMGSNTDKMTSGEIKRDVLVYANNKPDEFLQAIDDSDLEVMDIAAQVFHKGFLTTRRNDTEIWYNLDSNKNKLMNIQYGESPVERLGKFLKTDEGLEILELLKSKVSEG